MPLQILTRCVRDIALRIVQRLIIPFRLLGQHNEMHERVGVHDDQQDWHQEEEGEQRQFNVEERQLDRVFEKEIGVRHRASGER